MKHKMKLKTPDSERPELDRVTSLQDFQASTGRYVFASSFVNGKKVLDIACGSGYGSSYLLSKGATAVFGGDVSKEAIEYAQGHYHKNNLSYQWIDANKPLPFPDSFFDVVVSLETIEHLENPDAFLGECKRVMRSGGTFVCSTPNKEAMPVNKSDPEKPANPFHLKEYRIEEFQQLNGKYFQDIKMYGYIYYNVPNVKGKLVRLLNSFIYSSPAVIQNGILRIVGAVTKMIFRQYHPIIFEDVNERDFDKMITDNFKPFPVSNARSVFIFVVGQKQ